MKRKHEEVDSTKSTPSKRRALSDEESKAQFHGGLFGATVRNQYRKEYANSTPYKHGVIPHLIEDALLRDVRAEIRTHLSFAPKETDIYKIHQSGDLANLDGLDAVSLARLPSLLKLRDALYSPAFREYISSVAGFDGGARALSGSRTDMAINVYTPGCHLLCHDDVIGTRRLSYILYLTDPDKPWQPEWGGALRLYPTEKVPEPGSEGDTDDGIVRVPCPEFSQSIPPAWNQLAFFEVRPGESFHDVEEVYHALPRSAEIEQTNGKGKGVASVDDDGARVRMAISGWYHIPQEGEDGYEPGLDERLVERSSLAQLQGSRADRYELPMPSWTADWNIGSDGDVLSGPALDPLELPEYEPTDADFEFLLRFMDPSYLVPDTIENLAEIFEEESGLTLKRILNTSFAEQLREHIEGAEAAAKEQHSQVSTNPDADSAVPIMTSAEVTEDIMKKSDWNVARPPHKHHYLFKPTNPSPITKDMSSQNPLDELLNTFLPSQPFRKWLSLATGGLALWSQGGLMARRFRRGRDYQLATNWREDDLRLEFTLGLTPTKGWDEGEHSDDDEDEDEDENNDSILKKDPKQAAESKRKNGHPQDNDELKPKEPLNVGGYEVYMAGDDSHDQANDGDDTQNKAKAEGGSSNTGAGHRPKGGTADPAIYMNDEDAEDEGGGVLLSMAPSFNTMSLVLRDRGVLRFVKYVSKAANGDRWDIVGELGVEPGPD